MKKIISWLIVFAIMLSSVCFAAQSGDAGTDRTAQLLKDLNIYPETQFGDANITRGEFVSYVVRLCGVKYTTANQVFSDVTPEHEFFSEIDTAYSMGIIKGNDNGIFSPNDNIILSDAVETLIRLLGYSEWIKNFGGVKMAALRTGIMKGIKDSADSYLSVDAYTRLMKNVLDTDIMVGSVNGEYSIKEGEGPLSEFLKIKKMTGVVSECFYTALNGKSTTKSGELVLKDNDVEYRFKTHLSDDEIFGFLGKSVELYYRAESDDNIAVSVIEKETNRELVIDAGKLNIDKLTKTEFLYADRDATKDKSAKISKSAYVIYNKSAVVDYTVADFKITNGKIRLVDADGNGIYEVVFITEYIYTYVDRVNTSDQTINDKFMLNYIFYDEETVIYADGEKIPISSLVQNDLIEVEKDKEGKVTTIRRINDKIVGTVERIKEDSVFIDGEEYYFSGYYKSLDAMQEPVSEFISVKLGKKQCMVMNEYNEILIVVDIPVTGADALVAEYGFLIAVGKESRGVDPSVKARILNSAGVVETLKFRSRTKIDGSTISKDKIEDYFISKFNCSYVGSALDIGEIVLYTVNKDGVISEVDTPYFNAQKEDNTSLKKDLEDVQAIYAYDTGYFSGRVGIGPETIVFRIPANYSTDNKYYGRTSMSVNGKNSTICAYNMKRDGVAGVITVEEDSNNTPGYIDNWADVYMVDEIINVLDQNGEIREALVGHSQKGRKEFIIDKDFNLVNFERGDLIRVGFNFDNELNNIEVVMRLKDRIGTPFMSGEPYAGNHWYWFGEVVYTRGNIAAVRMDAEGNDIRYFNLSDAFVRAHYIYNGKRNGIQYVSMNDIVGSESGKKGDWILMYAWKGKVKDIYVYRNVGE